MKKDSHYLFTDSCVLSEIIKCPASSNVPEGTKDKKRKRSGGLMECINVSFLPSLKQWMILSKGNKLLKRWVWHSKSPSKYNMKPRVVQMWTSYLHDKPSAVTSDRSTQFRKVNEKKQQQATKERTRVTLLGTVLIAFPYGDQWTSRPVFLSAFSSIYVHFEEDQWMQLLVLLVRVLVRARSCWKEGCAVCREIASGIEANVAGACCHQQCNQTNSSMALFLLHCHATVVPLFTSNNNCFVGGKVRRMSCSCIICDSSEEWRM